MQTLSVPLLDACRRCDLWREATHGVPGAGPSGARIMLVGEQPGDQEDLQGAPFVGPAGKLLDAVLQTAGIDRGTVYVTNAVKHFKWEPRGKRRLHKTPAQREVEACSYWLEQEIEEVRPVVVVALGSTALKSLLHSAKVNLTQLLGQAIEREHYRIIPTYHPAYVLRVPGGDARARAREEMARHLSLARNLASPRT